MICGFREVRLSVGAVMKVGRGGTVIMVGRLFVRGSVFFYPAEGKLFPGHRKSWGKHVFPLNGHFFVL